MELEKQLKERYNRISTAHVRDCGSTKHVGDCTKGRRTNGGISIY